MPTLRPNYYPNGSGDLDFHIIRIVGLAENIKNGIFPSYINPVQLKGFGYPSDIFYPYVFLVIPALMYLKGLSLVFIMKVVIFFVSLSTLLVSYYSANSILKDRLASVFAAILYTFSSYRIYDFYMRGGVGSTLAFIFLPLAFLGLYEILYRDEKKIYLLTIGYSGILLSHFLTAFITLIFMFIIMLFNFKKIVFQDGHKKMKSLFLATILSLLLTSFYLVPLLEQLFSYTSFVEISSIVNIDETASGLMDMISVTINNSSTLPSLGLLLFSVPFLLMFLYVKKIKIPNIILTSSFIGIFTFFASINLFPWRILRPFIGFIQYPARLLIFSSLFLALVGGYCISVIVKKSSNKKSALMLVVFFIFSITFHQLYEYRIEETPHYMLNGDFTKNYTQIGVGKEYLPINTNVDKILKKNKVFTDNKHSKILNTKRTGLKIETTIQADSPTKVTFPLIYYKGYEAFQIQNNKRQQLPIKVDNNHLATVNIKSNSILQISYKGTLLQKLSLTVSIVTFLILSALAIYKFKK